MHSFAQFPAASAPKSIDTFSGWRDAIQELFPGFDPKPGGIDNFKAMLNHWMIGELDIAEMNADRSSVLHDRLDPRAAMRPGCCLILQAAGQANIEQANRVVSLRPGDMTLVDGTRPVQFDFAAPYKQIAVRLRHQSVEQRFGGIVPVGQFLSADNVMTDVIRTMILSLSRGAASLDEAQANLLVSGLLDLVGGAIRGQDRGERGHRRSEERHLEAASEFLVVKHYVERHLGDHDLNPQVLARGIGVSERKLYRLFERVESTPSQWILEQRLEKARALLTADQNRNVSISSVAMRCGFTSFSHFSRSYKQRFGLSPKDQRNAIS